MVTTTSFCAWSWRSPERSAECCGCLVNLCVLLHWGPGFGCSTETSIYESVCFSPSIHSSRLHGLRAAATHFSLSISASARAVLGLDLPQRLVGAALVEHRHSQQHLFQPGRRLVGLFVQLRKVPVRLRARPPHPLSLVSTTASCACAVT